MSAPPDGATLEELWARWLADQELDPADRAALFAGVEQNEVFRRRVVQDWQTHNALWAAAGSDGGRDAMVARVKAAAHRSIHSAPPAAPWYRWSAARAAMALGVLGAAAAVLVLAVFGRPDRPPGGATITRVSGQVTVHTPTEARLGGADQALHAGDIVSTVGAAARVTLTFGEGPRLDLGPDSSLAVRAARNGELSGVLMQGHASAAAQAMRLDTPHATVLGKGRLVIDVAPRHTFVEVQQGRARVTATGSRDETTLQAGQTTTVQPLASAGLRESPSAILLVAFRAGPGGSLGMLHESDRLFKSRLESLGFSVSVLTVDGASAEELRQASMVVLSFTVYAGALPDSYLELPVPVVALESSAFTQLRLTGPRWGKDVGNGPRVSEVTIANPDHPLAGGLEGSVRVFTHAERLRWAAPPDTATSVASYSGAPDENSLVFGFDKGDFTADGRAPARRVGLFLGNEEIVHALTEQGWRLFDAAVTWCAAAQR